ncbi:MAG: heavy metal translocating P-type ATPase [Gemmatimonadetes bacterium]|uniref:Heavy metal translocating P-type ATPase n=1 Tax=Candidatus Kutchimonas denitrificans TaxID=3056748 RepID=A0AAE4ZD01_9BACT|nr:heavy metal translocating P-type ATPase [Gemmatimonadota bacterium]NIR76451.1 heavy metal translocating P-type ATPase [Candidatus Kutchimonas denitrificans]NIS03269.1 heavy metal translocating P-type ATPase [Gemmatimonadota bacterium]NIT69130.1 heavy metal translocating P-type ATPase [Gemmatimonadota bacterium]NIU54522.1 heavy metal translocating P-type ATPase [Gemmatimonadota bacterium]
MGSSDAGGTLRTVQLKVGGMSCSFCSESIRKAVGRQRGVEEVHVSLAHEEALVRYRPDRTDETRIGETLRALGYTVRDPRKVRHFEEQQEAMAREKRNLLVASVFAGISFAGMLAMWLDLWAMRVWHTWLALGMASFVLFWTGRHILKMAWGAARRGIANQHVLLTAGALGGYLAGLLGTPVPARGWWGLEGFPAVDFYGVVMFLTTYHLLSGYVSLWVRTRASQSVRRLLELQPPTARVVRDGREEEVAIDTLTEGDRVRIRPGEKVPVDGIVVEGGSAVDEALVTGEPIPSEKAPGDEVIGGSVNQSGTLLVRVTRTGEGSFLHQVARHVEEAKALKPGIIVLVDRVLRYYVPAVLLIALGALLFWSVAWGVLAGSPLWLRAMYAALSVLVMGYPCALGMATPLALIRGGGMAAERGILMRSGEAFQVLREIEVVVLDKTGTLTVGAPRVVQITPVADADAEAIVRHAAEAERPSEHPLGRAIVEHAEQERIEVGSPEDFHAVTGGGVEARLEGRSLLVGTLDLLTKHGIAVESAREVVTREEARGRTAVLVAVEGRLEGVISIADTLKNDAAEAIAALKDLGLRPVMLTGDAERTARAVAAEVGIEEVRARVLPDGKAEQVRELQTAGRRVAFVGDGINDAPALMQADVGIAIGAGTDIAIESSDVILIGERLGAVVDAYHIGQASYRKTVQNLWLAFLFNGVGVPLAATGIVHPVWAMLAMATSVSTVLLNSFGGRILPKHRERIQSAVSAGLVAERPGRAEPEGADAEAHALEERGGSGVTALVLDVPDIHCRGCEMKIETLLSHRAGVMGVAANAGTHSVRVDFRPDRIDVAAIEDAVASLGYRVQRVDVTEMRQGVAVRDQEGDRRRVRSARDSDSAH